MNFLSTYLRSLQLEMEKQSRRMHMRKKNKKSLKSRRIYPNQSDVFSIVLLSIQNVVLAVCDNSRLHVRLSIGKHWYNPNVTMPCTILGRGPSIFIKVPPPYLRFCSIAPSSWQVNDIQGEENRRFKYGPVERGGNIPPWTINRGSVPY